MRGCQERNRSPATRRFGGGLREPRGVCVGGQALGRRRWRPGPPARPWLPGSGSLPRSVLPCLSPKVEATPARRGRSYTCCAGSWAPDIAEAVGVSSRRPDPVGIPPPPTRGAPLCRFSPGSSPPSMCPVPPLPGSFATPHSVPSVAPPQVCVCLSVWVTSEAGGRCVCLRKGQAGDSLSGRLLAPSCLATSHLQTPPPRPHSQIQADTHIYTHAYTHHLTSLGFP